MVSPFVIANVSIANWQATLVQGINHESADKPTGLAARFVSSLRRSLRQSRIMATSSRLSPTPVSLRIANWMMSTGK
jgi:hypothetical protein